MSSCLVEFLPLKEATMLIPFGSQTMRVVEAGMVPYMNHDPKPRPLGVPGIQYSSMKAHRYFAEA